MSVSFLPSLPRSPDSPRAPRAGGVLGATTLGRLPAVPSRATGAAAGLGAHVPGPAPARAGRPGGRRAVPPEEKGGETRVEGWGAPLAAPPTAPGLGAPRPLPTPPWASPTGWDGGKVGGAGCGPRGRGCGVAGPPPPAPRAPCPGGPVPGPEGPAARACRRDAYGGPPPPSARGCGPGASRALASLALPSSSPPCGSTSCPPPPPGLGLRGAHRPPGRPVVPRGLGLRAFPHARRLPAS